MFISLLTMLAAEIPTVPATPGNAVDFTWLFLKMFFILGIVSVLAVLLLKYAVPHFGLSKRFHRSKCFVVHARHTLEPGKSLYLVEVGNRYFVIGVTDHGIHPVTELTRAEAQELGYAV